MRHAAQAALGLSVGDTCEVVILLGPEAPQAWKRARLTSLEPPKVEPEGWERGTSYDVVDVRRAADETKIITDRKLYSRAEVAAAINRQTGTQKRLQQVSPGLAVLSGTNWVFNPEPPLDPALVATLGQHFTPELSYTAAVRQVVDAFIDVHVGWQKRGTGGAAQRSERWALQEQAVEDALEKLNVLLEGRRVRFVAEAGPATKTLTDIKIKVRSSHGRARSNHRTKQSVVKETSLYLVFNEGEPLSEATAHSSGEPGPFRQGPFWELSMRP